MASAQRYSRPYPLGARVEVRWPPGGAVRCEGRITGYAHGGAYCWITQPGRPGRCAWRRDATVVLPNDRRLHAS